MVRIPFKPRKRTIVGGLVVVGIVIGAFLSGMLPGFGTGSGDGDGSKVSVSTSHPISSTLPIDERTEIVSSETLPTDPDVLEVVVKDESYSIRTVVAGTEKLEPAELRRIVKLAKETDGNDDGIRVVILRDKSALFLTWKTLEEELTKAGLPPDSVEVSRLQNE